MTFYSVEYIRCSKRMHEYMLAKIIYIYMHAHISIDYICAVYMHTYIGMPRAHKCLMRRRKIN